MGIAQAIAKRKNDRGSHSKKFTAPSGTLARYIALLESNHGPTLAAGADEGLTPHPLAAQQGHFLVKVKPSPVVRMKSLVLVPVGGLVT